MSVGAIVAQSKGAAGRSIALASWPLHAVVTAPEYLYLGTLTIFLFRPPDVNLYHLDRISFALVVFVVALRALWLRQQVVRSWSITIPMFALTLLAAYSAAGRSFEPQTWSLLSAEFVVPFVLFHLAGVVFDDARSRRKFEIFAVVVLAYLCLQAIASLSSIKSLVFPRYILDENLGIHLDRARGPFLQAVANGVSLIVLGLVALDCFRRRVLSRAGLVVLALVPVAVFATMTRAVWIAACGSVLAAWLLVRDTRIRRACLALLATGALGLLAVFAVGAWRESSLDRATEAGPVEIRAAVYSASWEMVGERPLLGWGQNQMPAEVVRRMPDYDLEAYWAHNTYLEILVEHGSLGLGLYLWIVIKMFRLTRSHPANLGFVWPIIFGVYVFNAIFVVMNYQFVNALIYTIAGIVATQPCAVAPSECTS